MSKQRIKIPLIQITTRTQAEETLNSLAKSLNAKKGIIAEMDAKILAIKNEYETSISVLDEAIKLRSDALCTWAETNPDEFGKKKSITFLAGIIGFRTGTPKLALLSRAWNWEKVLTAIQEKAFAFTRTTPEIDKDAILAFAASESDKEALNKKVLTPIGVKIVQDESFYIEPDLTKIQAN